MGNVVKATFPLKHKNFKTENQVEPPRRPDALDDEGSKAIQSMSTVDSLYRGAITYRYDYQI